MIELIKEKSYTVKDPKMQLFKQTIMFDKFRLPKFNCAVISAKSKEYEMSVFIGLNNGNIVCLKLSRQKSLFHKFDETILLQCKDDFKHRGPVFTMISELIEGVSVLFSGGVDGTIKYWNTELEDQKESHYTTTIFGHKGTVLALAFCKTKNILVSSSSDKTIKVWKIKDNFDKIMNPLFHCIATFKDFSLKKKKDDENPFWINTLSLKETDIIELYAGDTKGRVHFYHFVDQSYIKIKENEKKIQGSFQSVDVLDKKWVIDNFNLLKIVNPHTRTVIKVVHSMFDSMIYSVGFDNHLTGYNLKNDNSKICYKYFTINLKKEFLSIPNTSKSHFSCLAINYFTQELIIGDDKGGLNFIKIFNKSEIKLRVLQSKILFVQTMEIFNDQEHILVLTEDNLDIYRVKRETKVVNVQYHDAEIIKLFIVEPERIDNKIVEDAK